MFLATINNAMVTVMRMIQSRAVVVVVRVRYPAAPWASSAAYVVGDRYAKYLYGNGM